MKCGNCGAVLDGHTCLTDKKAEMKNGNISICFYCGEICQFVDGKLVVVDVKNLPKDVQVALHRLENVRQVVVKT